MVAAQVEVTAGAVTVDAEAVAAAAALVDAVELVVAMAVGSAERLAGVGFWEVPTVVNWALVDPMEEASQAVARWVAAKVAWQAGVVALETERLGQRARQSAELVGWKVVEQAAHEAA